MMRFFAILEGEGKGTRKAFTEDLMIVGRSKNADLQIEDSLVSRRHLEIRVDGDAVFVENKSAHGSYLNGKLLAGVVSLNPGDVLDIGHTKLSYEETPDEVAPSRSPDPEEAMSSEIDGTRIADSNLELEQNKDKEVAADSTRAVVEDGTRMLDEKELPNWVAAEKGAKAASPKGNSTVILMVIFLLALGGLYWSMSVRKARQAAASIPMDFKDSLYAFNLQYPVSWSKVTDELGVVSFGYGADGDQDWARLTIHTDNDPDNAITGFTYGFDQYQKVLKQRYDGFELLGEQQRSANGTMVKYYGMRTPKSKGLGFYILNGESRVVIECVSAISTYKKNEPVFFSILQSFHMADVPPQRYIEFPMPDDGMQNLALANPAAISREVDAHVKMGQLYLSGKDIKPDNLYLAVQEFRQALQLAVSPPEPLPAYHAVGEDLRLASEEYDAALDRQRFEIARAKNRGDNDTAYWEATKMMQMVPDKVDPAFQEALRTLQSLDRPRGQ